MDCTGSPLAAAVYPKVPLDSLTRVLSRAYIDDQSLTRDLKRVRLMNQKLTVVMLDLDGFKRVNDQLGHQRGDDTLEAFTAILKSLFPRPHKIVSYGGDEFYIFLFDMTAEEAAEKMEEVRRLLPERLAPLLGEELVPTMSVGIVQFPDHAEDPFEIKERADMAQYVSKKSGKDRITIFDDTTNTRYQELIQLEQAGREREIEQLKREVQRIKEYLGLE